MNSFRTRRSSTCQYPLEAIVGELREAAQQLLSSSGVPLEQRIRDSHISDSSVEELFGLISQQYTQRQDDTVEMWQLLKQAIDTLERQDAEHRGLCSQIETQHEQHYRRTVVMEDTIGNYREELAHLQQRILQTEKELLQTNQEKESLEELYQESMARRTSLSCRFLPEPEQQSEVIDKVDLSQQNLLQVKLRELQAELTLKDQLIGQKDLVKLEISQKLKAYGEKLIAAERTNHSLQETLWSLTDENISLRQQVSELKKDLDVLEKWNTCLETRATESEEAADYHHQEKTQKKTGFLFPVSSEKLIRYLETPPAKTTLAADIGQIGVQDVADVQPFKEVQELREGSSSTQQSGPSLRNISSGTVTPAKEPPAEDRDIVRTFVDICRKCSSKKKPAHKNTVFEGVVGWLREVIDQASTKIIQARLNRPHVGHFSIL